MRLFSRACWGWQEAQTDDDLSILSKNRHRYPTAATMMRKSPFERTKSKLETPKNFLDGTPKVVIELPYPLTPP